MKLFDLENELEKHLHLVVTVIAKVTVLILYHNFN